MANLDKITIDVVHESIHDQIKKIAQGLYDMEGIQIESINVNWHTNTYPIYNKNTTQIVSIDIITSKRG